MRRIVKITLVVAIGLIPAPVSFAASVYETQTEFLARAFANPQPEPSIIWLSGERKSQVRAMLGHDYPALRLRYWCREQRSAWILEEIGKELPITVGIIIDVNHISSLRVLTYRENRGGEVIAPAFTEQFNHATLTGEYTLDTQIDGITGATLSVQALTRLARVALYLHTQTDCNDGA
jgi:hypothetical protein